MTTNPRTSRVRVLVQREKHKDVALRSIIDLYLHPGRFFAEHKLNVSLWYFLATWIVGMSNVMNRIDSKMVQAELGRPNSGVEMVADSWAIFWGMVVVSGVISGFFSRWIGGWFYGVRLGWAGAREFDRQEAQQVFIYSSLINALPVVIHTLLFTIGFENYRDYWQSPPLSSILLLIFPLWATIAGYRGARACFDTDLWRARVWFLIIPLAFYTITLGAFASLYALFGS